MKATLSFKLRILVTAAALVAGSAPAAFADAGHSHGPTIGQPAKASEASRTVEIILEDIAFRPDSVKVKPGETVRFVLTNRGELLHEFNIGTARMHAQHQKEMMQMMEHGMLTPTGIDQEKMNMDHGKAGMPEMKHDDPNSVLVEPGETKELIWTFPNSHDLQFACNIPGHYEAGMLGEIKNAAVN